MAEIIKLNKPKEDFDHYINELSSLCKNDLNLINATILNRLDSNIPLIHEIASYLINSGGKRLRPLLTSCSYQLCKNEIETSAQHIWLAAAVEFIHTATLLHDDVVDESKKRRGKLTSNEVWGNKTSVLVGDFLFSRAFQLMAKDGSLEVLKLLSNTSVAISEGEVLELTNDKDPTINEGIYFKVIEGKTASLFSAACQVGAMVTNTSHEKIEALKTFGINFGMSFQLIDDVMDYSSSFLHLGKNIGDDFKEGKVTLPIILAYLRSNTREKKFWKKTICSLDQEENDFQKAIDIINKYNCTQDTIKRAYHFANIAKDSLGIFDDTKFKRVLINLIDAALSRHY
jgi:octaprenyl-diphosphate synthase